MVAREANFKQKGNKAMLKAMNGLKSVLIALLPLIL